MNLYTHAKHVENNDQCVPDTKASMHECLTSIQPMLFQMDTQVYTHYSAVSATTFVNSDLARHLCISR